MKTDHLTRDELHEHLDGRLTGDRESAVRRHLGGCRRCAAELASLETLGRALRSLPLERAGASLAERVMAQVGVPAVSSRAFRIAVFIPSVLGMVLVLAVMGGAYLMAGGVAGEGSPALQATGAAVTESLESMTRELMGWVGSAGSAGALAITAFALGLLMLVALGELLPAGPVRRDRGRGRG